MHNCQINYKYYNRVVVICISDSIEHPPLVYVEAVGSLLAGDSKFLGVLNICHTRLLLSFQHKYFCYINANLCLSYITMLGSGEHQLVSGQHICF